MNNYLLWAQLVSTLAISIAQTRGADESALASLSLLAAGVRAKRLSDADLQALSAKVQQELADGRLVTLGQLREIDAEVQACSDAIQRA